MKLPVLGPRDLFGVLERGADQVESLLGLVPRVLVLVDQTEALLGLGPRLFSFLDRAEAQLDRISPILDRVEMVAAAAAAEVSAIDVIVGQAQATIAATSAVVTQARTLVDRITPLLDRMEPSLTKLQPTLEVLANTTDPDEVAALVAMIDHLPELTRRLENDVLPVMGSLASVAPDLHDLLAVSSELNEIIGKLPGFGRIKRRVEEEQEEDAS